MHCEVWKKGTSAQPWRWHKMNQGKITCSAEGFPSKQHAERAARADVRQTIKPFCNTVGLVFRSKLSLDGKRTVIRWTAGRV